MANTKRPPKPNRKANQNWRGFVRCDLTRHDKEACREFMGTTEFDTVLQWFSAAVDDFKLSFSHDFDHSSYIASMTGSKHADEQFSGWTLTARANAWESALKVLMYKHLYILEETWEHEHDGYPEDGDKIG